MRIGIVTGEYPPMQGGVGAYTRILAHELARQTHEVLVFSSAQTCEADSAIDLTNTARSWGLATLFGITRWARHKHLDILNLQFQTAAYRMSPWIHFLPDLIHGIPVVTTFHDLRFPYLFPKAGQLRNWIVMRLARASEGVITTNHEDCANLGDENRKVLIPIGSNILQPLPKNFEPALWREKIGIATDDFVLAYFGLFNRTKGLDILLDSLRDLNKRGIPAHLVLVGGGLGNSDPTNAAFARSFQEQITRLGLSDVVHMTGYLDDESAVGSYLAASDVVVLPFLDGASYRRGSLVAAIHYGCTIVTTTPAVDVPEFRHGENMFLVPAGNRVGLQNTLLKLYHNPALRQQTRRGAYELAQRFEWSQIAQQYVTFFERILAEAA
jgi:glycosyltransferase involved in cell wall biosynthesis